MVDQQLMGPELHDAKSGEPVCRVLLFRKGAGGRMTIAAPTDSILDQLQGHARGAPRH